MTREEAKRMLPIIQAYADGKTIEILDFNDKWKEVDYLHFKLAYNCYRIKPGSKYRQFKTKEEFWSEMLKHQPFGWVIGGKDYENFYHIEYVYSCNPYNYHRVKLSQNDMSFNYEHMFRDFTFIDVSPFRIKDE